MSTQTNIFITGVTRAKLSSNPISQPRVTRNQASAIGHGILTLPHPHNAALILLKIDRSAAKTNIPTALSSSS
jgi:hypothetical protein